MQSLPEQISRYRVLGLIGKGGMGIVVKGYDEMLQRTVAIKILSPHLAQDETTVARFLSEARAAASLQHPNIITIYEAGEDKGLYYFVMEFVNGKDLATVLRERGSLSVEETLVIAEQIASALDYAHQRGIIHRDIKASNIMVTVDGLVKVTDFGIARVLGGERFTQTGVLVGTPEYMAPELWEGKEASKASDIYAFGVLVYEMLTGEVPFSGTTPMAVGYKHVHEPIPVERLKGHVSDGIIEALQIALSKFPEQRFQSTGAFVRAMKEEQQRAVPSIVTPALTSPAEQIPSGATSPAISLPTPVAVTKQKPQWLVWFAGLLIVLGLVAIIGGIPVRRWVIERRLEEEIYRALDEGRLVKPVGNNALEIYRKFRREFPNSAIFQRVRRRTLQTVRTEIEEHFDRWYRTSDATNEEWITTRQLCEWAVEMAPYDNRLKAMRQYCYGQLAFRERRYEDAIKAYKEAIKLDPDWALPYNSIGVAYIRQKNWTKVLEWCSQAKRRDSDWVFPYFNMGWAFYNLKRYDEAEQEYEKAAELNPDRPTIYCHLSCIYEKQGYLLDSLEMAGKAMEIAQRNPKRWETQIKDLQKRIKRLQRKVGFYDIEVIDE